MASVWEPILRDRIRDTCIKSKPRRKRLPSESSTPKRIDIRKGEKVDTSDKSESDNESVHSMESSVLSDGSFGKMWV